MKIVVFDTETTGLLQPAIVPLEKQPRIIELGLVVVENGDVLLTHNWLINPDCEITAEITKITGISNEDVADKPAFAHYADDTLAAFAGAHACIAHNAPFDVGMVNNEFKRLGREFVWPLNVICSAQEYEPVFGFRPRLIQLFERVMGEPLKQTHRALDDAMALYRALNKDGFFASLV